MKRHLLSSFILFLSSFHVHFLASGAELWQSWQDTFGGGLGEPPGGIGLRFVASRKLPSTSDDYFNPDFDPYKGNLYPIGQGASELAGMNIKRDPKTGRPL